jgi:hypothetical protein
MANNFSGDNTCQAYWRFESGALLVDSGPQSAPNLSQSGTVVADTTIYYEGAASANFNGSGHLYLSDANLPTNFPLRSTDTTKKFTFSFWLYANGSGACQFFCKNGSLTFTAWLGSQCAFFWGGSWYNFTNFTPTSGRWYHVIVRGDGVNGWLRLDWWDTTTNTYSFQLFTGLGTMPVNSNEFDIGCDTGPNNINGHLDGFVVFNRIISDYECELIRTQTFAGITPTNDSCTDAEAQWDFEAASIYADASGNGNTLSNGQNAPTADTNNYVEGAQSVSTTQYGGQHSFLISDGSLNPASFPFKSGDTVKLLTFCGWICATGGGGPGYGGPFLCKGYQYNSVTNLAFSFYVDTASPYHIKINLNIGGSLVTYDTGIAVSPNSGDWYHVAVTLDGTNLTTPALYVRVFDLLNQTVSTFTQSSLSGAVSSASTYPLGIGGDDYASAFQGQIDQFIIWNKILTSSQIDAVRSGTYTAVNVWQLTTAISITSAVSSPALAWLWKLATAVSVTSAVSSPVLGITRPLGTSVLVTSAVSTPTLQITFGLTTAINLYSATGTPVLAVIRQLSCALAVGTSTGSPLIAVTRPLSIAVAASSSISTVTLSLCWNLQTAISAISSVSSPHLNMLRALATAIQVVSQTSTPALEVLRKMAIAVTVGSVTSAPILAVIRPLGTSIQVNMSFILNCQDIALSSVLSNNASVLVCVRNGIAVGAVYTLDNLQSIALIYQNGVRTTFNSPDPTNFPLCIFYGVDYDGTIVGHACQVDFGPPYKGIIYKNGSVIAYLPNCFLHGIRNGLVVGYNGNNGIIYNIVTGVLTTVVSTDPVYTKIIFYAIDDDGTAVGIAQIPNTANYKGVTYKNGVLTYYTPTNPALTSLVLSGIDNGIAVGYALSTDQTVIHGIIENGGVLTEITSPDSNYPQVQLRNIDNGIIVGLIAKSDGTNYTPIIIQNGIMTIHYEYPYGDFEGNEGIEGGEIVGRLKEPNMYEAFIYWLPGYTTSVVDLILTRGLVTNVEVSSSTSSPNLAVTRQLTTQISCQSATSQPNIETFDYLTTAVAASSFTSAISLQVIRRLATAINIISYASDTVLLGQRRVVSTTISIGSLTSVVILGIKFLPPVIIPVKFEEKPLKTKLLSDNVIHVDFHERPIEIQFAVGQN